MEFASGMEPVVTGAVPLENGAVPVIEVPFDVTAAEPDLGGEDIEALGMEVPLEEIEIEPDAAAVENEGDGIDFVPLVVTGAVMEAVGIEVPLADTDGEPEAGRDEMEVPLVVAALLELVDVVVVLGVKGFRSRALMVISSWNGVKLAVLVLKKQLGPTMFGK